MQLQENFLKRDLRVIEQVRDLLHVVVNYSAAQLMLSEMQFERFIGLATSCGSIFTEFVYTPLLLSLRHVPTEDDQ
jgi:hypothetical protein